MTPAARILADDLTGAADCAAQALQRGLRAVVSLHPAVSDADVLAIDLDTRERGAEVARERTREAARDAAGLLYVKLDSRLRGHPGAAIDGALDGAGAEIAVVAPAFPAQGRRVPVAELAARLRERTSRPVTEDLERALGDPGSWVIACGDDLERIAAAGRASGRRIVWAGSAGLAGALFEHLAPAAEPAPAAAPVPGAAVLTVVGSAETATVAQLERLLARPGVVGIAVDEAEAAAEQASAALAGGDDVVLQLASAPDLAAAAAPAVEHAAGLLLTGGETARAVCDRAGVRAIELVAEVEPGVPLGRAGGLAIVTKSGGFGHPGTLAAAVDAIKEHCACLVR